MFFSLLGVGGASASTVPVILSLLVALEVAFVVRVTYLVKAPTRLVSYLTFIKPAAPGIIGSLG